MTQKYSGILAFCLLACFQLSFAQSKAVLEKDIALALEENPQIERKECRTSGSVSYVEKKVCPHSGEIYYSSVEYCPKEKGFIAKNRHPRGHDRNTSFSQPDVQVKGASFHSPQTLKMFKAVCAPAVTRTKLIKPKA